MATVNYTCPNCAAPLKFNPDKQMFSCEYCMSDFTEKYVQDFFAKKEQKENGAEKQEKKEQEKAKENAAKQAQSNDSAQAEGRTDCITAGKTERAGKSQQPDRGYAEEDTGIQREN